MTAQKQLAQKRREAFTAIDRSVERLDAEEKVRGSVSYTDDLEFTGLKHVKLKRSTIQNGEVCSIDTEEAERIDGVERVVTRDDVTDLQADGFDPYYGPAIRDQPVLALERVHHIGQPVAAVIADSPDIAEEAADYVDVTYDESEYVSDIDEALEADSPVVHEAFDAADTFDDLEHVKGGSGTNVAYEFNLERGDIDAAFEEADHVFENTFRTPPVQQLPLEPFVSVAKVDGDGKLRLWTPNQSPHFVRNELARMFGLAESKVSVEVPQVGGSYGAKTYCKAEPIVAVCAHLTDGPVKLSQSIDESFVTITRAGSKFRIRTAVEDDGSLLGQHCDVYYDSGAFADIVPRITKKSGYTASGPYEIPNVEINSHCVYTNKPPSGALRGFGVPQLVWAYERQMDHVAAELDIDPIELRRKNGFEEESIHPTGAPVESVGLMECLDAVVDGIDWDEPLDEPDEPYLKRGRAVAIGYKACLTPSSSGAIVLLSGDGSLIIQTSSVEIGQGVNTTLAQIVCEELGIPLEDVSVSQPNTDVSPFDTISAGSRSTFHMGNAVINAVEDIRGQLRDIAAREWDISPAEVVVEGGDVVNPTGGKQLSLGEAVKAEFGDAGGTIVGRGYYTTEGGHHDPETGQSDNPTVFWFFGATGAVVDVDVETGKVDVKELHNAADVGQAIDPERVEGQIQGAAVQSLGHTLNEEMVFEFGQQTNRQLLDYKVPSFRDMPDEVENYIVEVEHADGPFGAKGVGETGSLAVSPAIANAVVDATGAQVEAIPLTPERVLDAIGSRRNE